MSGAGTMRGKTNLLELEIGALVCHTLVSDTELPCGRLGEGGCGEVHLWDIVELHRAWGGPNKLVRRGRGPARLHTGGQSGCGEGVIRI